MVPNSFNSRPTPHASMHTGSMNDLASQRRTSDSNTRYPRSADAKLKSEPFIYSATNVSLGNGLWAQQVEIASESVDVLDDIAAQEIRMRCLGAHLHESRAGQHPGRAQIMFGHVAKNRSYGLHGQKYP